jgi:hypothetical protein
MQDGAVVKPVLAFGAGGGVRPLALAFREVTVLGASFSKSLQTILPSLVSNVA